MATTTSVEDLTAQRRKLPDQPGVYLFRDAKRRVIYVGKAKSIRKRVASHFSAKGRNTGDQGSAEMLAAVDHIEFVVTATEAEALLAEQNFIKQYKPRFNIRLRDDKSYPYIAISLDEDFPRVYFTRERHRRDRAYFGPYSNAKRVRGTLDLLQKVFLFRSCDGEEPGRRSGSPCLDYYIKRCEAPCVGYVTREEYREGIEGVVDFLSGRYRQIERDLEEKMRAAAADQEFEQAALHRNRLRAVRSLLERQRVANESVGTLDAIAVAVDGPAANAQVFQIRDGVLSDRQSFYLDNEAEQGLEEVAEAFILQYYASAMSIPRQVIVQREVTSTEALGEALAQRRGEPVEVRAAERGDKRRILDAADRCTQPGEIGALLRKEGIYSSHLTTWRRQRAADERAALAPQKRGRKADPAQTEDRRVLQLTQENDRLRRKLAQANAIIDVQKKLCALLGLSTDETPSEGC
jgi:excinuclease ABC, C subunit